MSIEEMEESLPPPFYFNMVDISGDWQLNWLIWNSYIFGIDLASREERFEDIREHCRKSVSRLQYHYLTSKCIKYQYSMEIDYGYSTGIF